jgi:hypothetical protein
MQILKSIAILASAIVIVAAGCAGRQPLNVSSVIVAKPNVTADEVGKAIMRAGLNANWRVVEQGPGQLLGLRVMGPHTASINISYTAKEYQISVKESSMMSPDGTVHRNLNRWLQELDQQIKSQMLAI